MKILLKFILFLFLFTFFSLVYLSLVGFETTKFNNQIIKKIKSLDNNFSIELKEIKIKFDPLQFKLNAKTIGPKLKYKNKVLEIENIQTQISPNSLINQKFIIENLNISTKPLEINKLISFIRTFNTDPELYILEKIIKKGFLVADVKLNFDIKGNIKNDFSIKGFVKDAKISIFKKYKVDNLEFIFDYNQNLLDVKDLKLSFNNLNFFSKNLNLKKIENEFEIKGEIENKGLKLDNKNLELLFNTFFTDLNITTLEFSSNNKFLLNFNNKFRLNNFSLNSEIELQELSLFNKLNLKDIFPKNNENIKFYNHKIKLNYEKKDKKKELNVNGGGNILLQDNEDELTYSINKKNDIYTFDSSLKIKANSLIINFLNYKKTEDQEASIVINGSGKLEDNIKFNLISLEEKNNKFNIEGLVIDQKLKIIDLEKANMDYLDKNQIKNKYNLVLKDSDYILSGSVFNADYLIDNLINSEDEENIINKNYNLKIKIDKLFLDKEDSLDKIEGFLSFNNQKILNGNLIGNFSDDKKFKLTINTNNDEKITTLFIDKASPFIRRYKFIKGFEEGTLDFYSTKKGLENTSTLKLYDFKLKELPVLTKLLTLASLQGIADTLSGEGIRFNEFEMNFVQSGRLIKINEIYAIGPAISLLMDGYIEKDKIISLRGTLVPATTLNKVIGSIPFLGDILVGSKTGEGVFGVSFKIKGPPNELETNVNPIKTLTPRFITRTLEKIKKN